MKKGIAILSVVLFMGATVSPSFAGDVKQKPKAKTECTNKKSDCKKDAKDCPSKGEKKSCCSAKK